MDYRQYDNNNVARQSRYDAFLQALRKNLKYLLLLGLLFTFALSPIITLRYVAIMHEVEIESAITAGSMSATEGLLDVNAFQNLCYIIYLPLSLLVALVLSGSANIIKGFAWRQQCNFKIDFSEGIKQNFIGYALILLLNVVLLWMNNFVINANTTHLTFAYLPLACWCIFCLPVSVWFCSATAVYKEKLLKTVSNSVKLYCISFLVSLGGMLLLFAPLALLLLGVVWIQLVIPLMYTLLYLPISLLGWTFIANSIFDKHINSAHFPELVDKGLL